MGGRVRAKLHGQVTRDCRSRYRFDLGEASQHLDCFRMRPRLRGAQQGAEGINIYSGIYVHPLFKEPSPQTTIP